MHVRVRVLGKPDTIVLVESKLTKIEQFRRIIGEKFQVDVKWQRLFYGGKLLEDGYTFHDYNIKLNDVIQLMVKVQPETTSEAEKIKQKVEGDESETNKLEKENKDYKDATSVLYKVGDLIDIKDQEQGSWFEGRIVRIVYDRDEHQVDTNIPFGSGSLDIAPNLDEKNKLLCTETQSKINKKGLEKYFAKKENRNKKEEEIKHNNEFKNTDRGLLYQVQFDGEQEDSSRFCKLKEIRPRARKVLDVQDLKVGQNVMINHNTEDPSEIGYWYDFTVTEIKKLRTSYELLGTLYLGPDAVPQNDTKIKIHDKIFAIEEVVPLAQRSEEYKALMVTPTEKRTQPLNCLTCRDDEDALCKDCGCFLCSRKENPEKIVLCDECNKGYHMQCLSPPLTKVPEEDWYCSLCKRDTLSVVAPGAAKQMKKTPASKSKRDWGRGMACVGKTKTCAMPSNHFGPIPGIEVGMCWRFRIQLSESGVHRPPVSGIHGRDVEGAYSIVLSGGYEDDVDNGNEFTYTGSGGRDLSGNKRIAEQSCDQTLTRENRALARNCAVKQITESGGDAGENWRNGKPVRVVRSYKMLKHFPKYAPKEGIRYDGIYKVVKYYPDKGLSGFRVWKYLLRRDDPSPAPWESGAKQYPIIYPDGYLEAEAEKKAQKMKNGKNAGGQKKRAVRESNAKNSDEESSPPKKKSKVASENTPPPSKKKGKSSPKNAAGITKVNSLNFFATRSPKSNGTTKQEGESMLSAGEREAIKADMVNSKLWEECLEICENRGKKEFVEHVTQVFLCIICQDVVVNPVTTPCTHNFCFGCLKRAFKSSASPACPYCRQSLAKYQPQENETLKAALHAVMPGYDAGKK